MTDEMARWRVFKWDEDYDAPAADRGVKRWHEIGVVETELGYTPPSPKTLGQMEGAGTYLCMCEDLRYAEQFEIEGITKWQQVEVDEEVPV